MKKIENVSKKIESATKKVEIQVKEKVSPKIKGLESVILGTLIVMVVAGLIGGSGLMLVAGALAALVLGLPKYSERLTKMIPEKKKPDVKVEVVAVKVVEVVEEPEVKE